MSEREGPGRPAVPPPGGLAGQRAQRERGSARAVRIRASRAGFLAVLVLALCTVPLATAKPWLAVLFVIPLAALLWVLRVGVDVDPDGVTVRALLGRRRFGWGEVAGLRAGRRGDLRLVLARGQQLRLPVARARHLPLIAAGSGGRVPTPSPKD